MSATTVSWEGESGRELLRSLWATLYAFALSKCRDAERAEDAVQHAFLSALERWRHDFWRCIALAHAAATHGSAGEASSAEEAAQRWSFMIRVVYHRIVDEWSEATTRRTDTREPEQIDGLATDASLRADPALQAILTEDTARVREATQRLAPDLYRKLFELSTTEGAAEYGLSIDRIKRDRAKALQQLRASLGDLEAELGA